MPKNKNREKNKMYIVTNFVILMNINKLIGPPTLLSNDLTKKHLKKRYTSSPDLYILRLYFQINTLYFFEKKFKFGQFSCMCPKLTAIWSYNDKV